MITPVDIEAQFEAVTEYWSPRVVARINDQYVKIAKAKGEFVWHAHEREDELFMVVRGEFRIELEDGVVRLGPGQFAVVPRGVRHKPSADAECWLVLIETVTTQHTGEVVSPLTKSIAEQLG